MSDKIIIELCELKRNTKLESDQRGTPKNLHFKQKNPG